MGQVRFLLKPQLYMLDPLPGRAILLSPPLALDTCITFSGNSLQIPKAWGIPHSRSYYSAFCQSVYSCPSPQLGCESLEQYLGIRGPEWVLHRLTE